MGDTTVSILNDLIETSKDGEKGFTKSAEDAGNAELKAVFMEGARRCSDAVRELQALVRSEGGDPEDTGSVASALHRGWVSLREAVTGRDDEAILEECERGEDVAKAAYRSALEKTDLPAEIRTVVQKQYDGVLRNHDEVRNLRDRFKATAH